jgi:hypothetical protein
LIAAAFLVVAVIVDARHSEQRKRQEHIEALAVSELPAGTEDSWLAYIDRRIAASIYSDGQLVHVAGMEDFLTKATTLVSRNTPYQITCDPILGTTVHFGAESAYGISTDVPILGPMLIDPSVEKPPPLRVDKASIASKRLDEILCARVASRLSAIMQNPPHDQ